MGMSTIGKTGRWAVSVAALATALSGCAGVTKREDLVRDPAACADAAFPIYFQEGSDQLTAPALQVLSQEATRLKPCRIAEARVLGLADATGSDTVNLELSKRRAQRVTEALAAQGLPAPIFDVEAAGAEGAVTPQGAEEPVRRRTEVRLRVAR